MLSRPCVVPGPSAPALPGVWFHVSPGNDYLMEKFVSFKIEGGKIETAVSWFPLRAGLNILILGE